MRFLARGLRGLALLALTLGLIAIGAGEVARSMRERAERKAPPRAATERIVAVGIGTVARVTATPVITAYGVVESRRMLEIRAAAPGPLVEISEALRDGGRVAAGDLLYRIDPADARSARDSARASLAEAEAEVREADAALVLAREDLAVAERSRDLRARALERTTELVGRRVATDVTAETAELAVAQADQTVVSRRQALAQAEARIVRGGLAADRARLALADAERALAETEMRAPFAGLVTDVTAVLGRRMTAMEPIARLIDPAALEVALRLSTVEVARLTARDGTLRPLPVVAELDVGLATLPFTGNLRRTGAEVGAGQTGRIVYAGLEVGLDSPLRPGDFLTVTISEPPIPDVSVLPATAVTEDGRLLVLGPEDRLEERVVTILRRQRDTVIVSGAPEGARFVLARLPVLGPGLKVKPVAPEAAALLSPPEMVRLTPERRAALLAVVEQSRRLPPEARRRLIARLNAEEVPRDVVERIERRTDG